MTNAEMGVYLARKLFELGDEGADKAQRLEFKGGRYPDHETRLGGLCETSLASSIAFLLDRLGPTSTASTGDLP